MDMIAILKHGHQVVLDAVVGLSPGQWGMDGVCGVWSAKDIVGHLASVEGAQFEILCLNLGRKIDTPYLEQVGKLGPAGFNTKQTEVRRETSYQDVLAEYTQGFDQVIQVLRAFPDDVLHESGRGSFYVDGYSLADWFVHGIYGHKREHAGQIVSFHERARAMFP